MRGAHDRSSTRRVAAPKPFFSVLSVSEAMDQSHLMSDGGGDFDACTAAELRPSETGRG